MLAALLLLAGCGTDAPREEPSPEAAGPLPAAQPAPTDDPRPENWVPSHEDPDERLAFESPATAIPPAAPASPTAALPDPVIGMPAPQLPRNALTMGPWDGDASNVSRVVKANKGRVETCVQHSLTGNPSLHGRLSAGWTITAGKVSDVHLVQNDTGDDALGACFVRAVQSFRFDENLTATVDEYPWLVSGQ